jgi:hypothetical protein
MPRSRCRQKRNPYSRLRSTNGKMPRMKGTAAAPRIANPSPPIPEDATLSRPRMSSARPHCKGRSSTMSAGPSQSHHTTTRRVSGFIGIVVRVYQRASGVDGLRQGRRFPGPRSACIEHARDNGGARAGARGDRCRCEAQADREYHPYWDLRTVVDLCPEPAAGPLSADQAQRLERYMARALAALRGGAPPLRLSMREDPRRLTASRVPRARARGRKRRALFSTSGCRRRAGS